MPTTRPRHPITETQEVVEALKVAASRWPEDRDKPRLLLLHLIAEGVDAVRVADRARATARQAAVARTAGSGTDLFEDDYLARLRDDWPEMTVLDASLVIAHLNAREPAHPQATAFLTATTDQDLQMSTVTMAEVLVAYARAGRLPDGVRDLAALGIQELPIPDGAATRLAALRAETGLKLPDCCVLLAAEQSGSALASFDGRLRDAADRRGLRTVP